MKHIPMRMCVACRTMRGQNELIRVVHTDGGVRLDMQKKLFGRGAYICKNSDCVRLAAKKHALERHFQCEVPKEVYAEAESVTAD